MSFFLFLAAVAAAPTPVAPQVAADSPLIAQAKTNRAQVKTRPVLTSKPLPDYDAREDAARAMGHHGNVAVEGVLGTDGRFADPRIRTSSRAAELDALALDSARAATFVPAKNAAGVPITIWTAMVFEFRNRAADQGGGLMKYRCDAFVQDMDWWRSAWPEREWKEHEFYKLVLGYETIGVISARGSGPAAFEQVRTRAQNFPARWAGALDACRARPGTLFVDAMRKQNG